MEQVLKGGQALVVETDARERTQLAELRALRSDTGMAEARVSKLI